jgi:hypothetical protein
VHVLDVAGLGEQVKQQRGRDVVGQVADDAQFFAVAELGEIEFERVGQMQADR